MTRVVETVRLADGMTVKRLTHYKCNSCGSRFFDDDAMHAIQAARTLRGSSAKACWFPRVDSCSPLAGVSSGQWPTECRTCGL